MDDSTRLHLNDPPASVDYTDHISRVRAREAGVLASDIWSDSRGWPDYKAEKHSYRVVAELWRRENPASGLDDWDAAAAYLRDHPPA